MDIVEKIRIHWSKKAGRELTRQDAKEIIHNLAGVINLLDQWDREAKEAKEAKAKSGKEEKGTA